MFDKQCRAAVERSLRPVGSGLGRTGISANQLTIAGVLISAGSALCIGRGWLGAGAVLLALSAVPDLLDGAVAKASGTASPRGAFLDSVADRVSDSLVLGGVAWYLLAERGDHTVLLPVALIALSNLVSYERARAESLGFSARGGLMERAERMMGVGLALVFSALIIPVLWVMNALTAVTAVHRFVMVWRQAGAPAKAGRPEGAGRWRGWRPSVGFGGPHQSTGARWRTRRASRSRSTSWRWARTRP